jgi:hypothetical protein
MDVLREPDRLSFRGLRDADDGSVELECRREVPG